MKTPEQLEELLNSLYWDVEHGKIINGVSKLKLLQSDARADLLVENVRLRNALRYLRSDYLHWSAGEEAIHKLHRMKQLEFIDNELTQPPTTKSN